MACGRRQKLAAALICSTLAFAGAPVVALAETAEADELSITKAQVTLVQEGTSQEGAAQENASQETAADAQTTALVAADGEMENIIYTPTPTNVTYKNMYRLFNPNSGEHFFTADWNEATSVALVGWRLEGVGWVAPSSGDAVYRLYNPNGGDHHYTLSKGERDLLIGEGWSDEGIGWYSDNTAGGVGVYRQYNPNASTGAHNFTMSKGENDYLVEVGWNAEGIAWNASSVGAMNVPEGWISNANGDRIYVNSNATVNVGLFYIGDVLYYGNDNGMVLRNQIFTVDGVRYQADDSGALSLAPIPEGYESIFGELAGLSSATDYAIVVDTYENKVGVFQGAEGNWSLIRNFDCTSGAYNMPTVKGTFTLTDRGYSFGTNVYTCYYWTRFYGDYLFHSVLYDAGTFNIQDGRLGENLSHGCVRLDINDAQWINETVPYGTVVRII